VAVGSLLARGGEIVAEGWNRRVQLGDPIAHGEMDCVLENRNSAATRTF
jgi:cytosine deaminase